MSPTIRTHSEELVEVLTGDGLPLSGVLIRPAAVNPHPLLVLWIQGLGVRFYLKPVVDVCRLLAASGYTSLSINTRGHDWITRLTTSDKRTLAGAAFERFEDCLLDLDAWLTFAGSLGFRRVVLVGHSMGAVKAVYYLAERPDPRVVSLVMASGSPFSGTAGTAPDPALAEQAERMVAEGRGEELLPWGSLPWGSAHVPTVSAQTYASRARVHPILAGDSGRAPALSSIQCPIFAFFVAGEPGNPREQLEQIRKGAVSSSRFESRLVEGDSHAYRECEAPVAAAITTWLDTLRT